MIGTLRPTARARMMEPGFRWNGAVLLLITLVLSGVGLIVLASASALLEPPGRLGFTARQLLGMVAGWALIVAIARLDYRQLRAVAWPFLLVSVALLLLLVLPWTEGIAPTVNGARRWLHLGVVFQPAEVAKLALVVWAAAIVVRKGERLTESFKVGILPFVLVGGTIVGMVALQPDLSSALVISLLLGTILFTGGARLAHLAGVVLAAIPILALAVRGAGYRWDRVLGYITPGGDLAGISYQVNQSLIAVGSGGVTGVGFGMGEQKIGFLPEPHNDFILATIGEEWGFIGVAILVLLVAAFGYVGLRIAARASDRFGHLLAIGMTAIVVIPALLHIAVVFALVPATGIPFPFVSYGRSSLIVSFIAVGVLLSVHRGAIRAKEAR